MALQLTSIKGKGTYWNKLLPCAVASAVLIGTSIGLFLCLSSAAIAKKYNVEDFMKSAEKSRYSISPNGEYIAYMGLYEGYQNIFVYKRGEEQKVKRITSETKRDINEYTWKGDRILYAKDIGGDENYHIVSVNREGEDLKDLTPGTNLKAQVIQTLDQIEDEVLIAHNAANPALFDVYRVNVRTGAAKKITENPGNMAGWAADHEGQLRLALTMEANGDKKLLYRDKETEPFKNLLTIGVREQFTPLVFTKDNQKLYVASNLGRDKLALALFDPQKAQEVEIVYQHQEVDVGGLDYSEKRAKPLAVRYTTWKTERKFLDPQMEALYRFVEKKLPDYVIDFTTSDKNEEVWIVKASSDRKPGLTYLFDTKDKSLVKLADAKPQLKEEDMAVMKPVQYLARDGVGLQGYLTLPRGKNTPVPLIVLVHGGPFHRDVWGFDPEAQLLANRGYGVLQINFRGSTGYGRQFTALAAKQWGKNMQNDLTDGVKWAISKGIADPKKIGIYGISYGGYAALAGATFTPSLYAVAISSVGPSNLITWLNNTPPYWKIASGYLEDMIGNPEKDRALLESASPALHVDKIEIPLLIAQGANDPRVPKQESEQMVAALRAKGKPVEYMYFEDEGHHFQSEKNRLLFYNALDKFLAKYLPPKDLKKVRQKSKKKLN